MLKSFAILSLFSSVVLAQSSASSASTAAATASPFIPSDISPGCNKFLTALNNNDTLAACTTSITDATSAFSPGTSASAAQAASALSSLCGGSTTAKCPDPVIREQLNNFYSACSAELTSDPSPQVVQTYDFLYAIKPMIAATCAKNDAGNNCAQQPVTSTSSGLTLQQIMQYIASPMSALSRRSSSSGLTPNMTTFGSSNIAYLLLSPDLPSASLCTPCTRNVLTSYIDFESTVPYAPGLPDSQLLPGQSDLYNAVQDKCGASFLSGAVQAAGGLSGDSITSGAVGTDVQKIVGFVAGAFVLAVSSVL